MTSSKKNTMRFEEAFEKLASVAEQLEKGDTDLEESIRIFEEGVKMADVCHRKLNEAETRLQKLIADDDGQFRLELSDETE